MSDASMQRTSGIGAPACTQAVMLDCYHGVASATRRMLDAARAGDWHALRDMGRDCETWMQRIEALPEPERVLDADGRRQRMALLHQVLRDDAALRELLEPSLGRVDRWLAAGARAATSANA
jgi:flagellar protein FliT